MDGRLKTFIVEDNLTIRENLVGTLEELTRLSTVGHAETEDDAREWFTQNPDAWDVAVVDLFLRQGSGLGVVHALSTRRSEQKVVVLTNYATPEIRRRCARLGADVVFDKSNEIEGLVDYCVELGDAQLAR